MGKKKTDQAELAEVKREYKYKADKEALKTLVGNCQNRSFAEDIDDLEKLGGKSHRSLTDFLTPQLSKSIN